MTASEIIQHLQLQPHPEGGFYREVYRSQGTIDQHCLPAAFGSVRSYATSIYYLLERGDYSAFHRIKSDEIWYFHAGGNLLLHLLTPEGLYQRTKIGNTLAEDVAFQAVMPAGSWFAAEPEPEADYVLAGCAVAPGFDFNDFELAEKESLAGALPQHKDLILRLCR